MEKLNYNMGAQKKLSLLAVTTDTTATHEISEEFNLPDYIPEVRKMLTVRAGVLPESKYLADKGSGSQLDFGGTVTYLVIYTDDEGNLCSTPLSSAYEASTQLSSHPETVLIDTVVDNTSVRVNAMRKILNRPVVLPAFSSTLFVHEEGNVSSKPPRNDAPKSNSSAQKNILNTALVERALSALAPKNIVTAKPKIR